MFGRHIQNIASFFGTFDVSLPFARPLSDKLGRRISVYCEGLSNTVKRKIARVSKLDKENEQYMLAAYLIAQLGKNFQYENDKRITGKQLLNLAIDKIREIQYMAGGKVMFLEAENKEKLLNFYERENGFKQFNKRPVMSKEENGHTLVQLLQVL